MEKMNSKLCEQNDHQSALLLGDVEERVKILKSAGQSESGVNE